MMFTIIVPVYNVESYLCRCLDSLVNQTFRDIEILLINDGSTDSSGDICSQYAEQDDRVKVIHQENQGPSVARNTGLKVATGRFVLFVDSDDFIELNTFEVFADIISNQGDIDMIVGNHKTIRPTRTILNLTSGGVGLMQGIDFLALQLESKTFWVAPWKSAVSREFLLKHDLFFVDLKAEDQEWTPRVLLSAQKVYISDFVHYHYIIRENSLISQKRKIGLSILQICILHEPLIQKVTCTGAREVMRNHLLFERYLGAIKMAKLSRKEFRHLVDKDFLRRNAPSKSDKAMLGILFFCPIMYFNLRKIKKSMTKRLCYKTVNKA